jgi:hypothetical protein
MKIKGGYVKKSKYLSESALGKSSGKSRGSGKKTELNSTIIKTRTGYI